MQNNGHSQDHLYLEVCSDTLLFSGSGLLADLTTKHFNGFWYQGLNPNAFQKEQSTV